MIPASASFLDFASLAVAAWLLTYLIHSTILLGAVRLAARFLKPALTMEETLWKMALVGAMATALWQVAGLGATPFGHQLVRADRPHVTRVPAADGTWAWTEAADRAPSALVVTGERTSPERTWVDSASPAVVEERETVVLLSPTREHSSGRILEGSHDGDREAGAAITLSPAVATWTTVEDPPPGPAGLRETLAGTFNRAHGFVAGLPWALILLAGWALGAFVGVFRLVLARLRLRRLLRGRSEIAGGHLIGMLDRLRAAAGVRRPVTLSLSPRLAGPVALGKSEVCLPRRVLTDLTPAQQQTVLAHELAHLERGDPGWLWLSALVEAVFFFQPLNRTARRRLRDLAEFLCDDWAVRHAGGNLILARCLAEVAGWVQASPALASGMAQKSSPLVRRIERLLEDRDLFREPGRGWRWLAGLALVGAVAMAAPGITTGSYQRPDNAPWSSGPSPWPDYPFVLTPPGWTTTPLSATTWSSAPILEGDGQLGEIYGYPAGLPQEIPADVLYGYPSTEEDERFVRAWPSPRMQWYPARPARPAPPAVRSLPPSPRQAVRIHVCCETDDLSAGAVTTIERAPRLQPLPRNQTERAPRLQPLPRKQAERAPRLQPLPSRQAREAVSQEVRAREAALHEYEAQLHRRLEAPRHESEARLHRQLEAPRHESEARLHRELETARPSVTLLSGEFTFPSEELSVLVEDLSEQLDSPIAVALGDLAAAIQLDSKDGQVDIGIRLDRLAEARDEVLRIKEAAEQAIAESGLDAETVSEQREILLEKFEELKRADNQARFAQLQRVLEALQTIEIRTGDDH